MLGRVADHEAQPPAAGRHIADGDARLTAAKLGGYRFFHRLQPLLGGIGDIGLEQQLAAAGDIEAEVDAGARQPCRPALDLVLGEQAGNRQQHAGENDQADQPDLPAGEVEHQSLAGLAAVGSITWVRVDLTAVTRTFWPSSTSTSLSLTLMTLPISPPPVTTRSPFFTASIRA